MVGKVTCVYANGCRSHRRSGQCAQSIDDSNHDLVKWAQLELEYIVVQMVLESRDYGVSLCIGDCDSARCYGSHH